MKKTILVLSIAASLALSGCGKKADETARPQAGQEKEAAKTADKPAAKPKVDIAKGKTTIQTNTGEKVEVATGAEGIKLPADFPKDVHVYAGSSVVTSFKTPEAEQVTLSTPDATDKVSAAYKTEMEKSGWKEKLSMQQAAGMAMMQYTKDDRTVNVQMVTGDDKVTKIILSVTKEKEAPHN